MTKIVDLVRNRVKFYPPTTPAHQVLEPAPPIQPSVFSESEAVLGFRLPQELKQLYVELGNGGFGPGYGLLGLLTGTTDDLGETAVSGYLKLLDLGLEGGVPWPERLVPICSWGCAIYSCVDCSTETFPMTVFDPNLHRNSCMDWSDAFFSESCTFASWIELWARSVDLWGRLYDEGGLIATVVAAREGDG